jgi:glutathione S-transferase
MRSHAVVAIVTVVALMLYFWMSVRVSGARTRFNIPAPAISGHEDFDRIFRVHANTLEWLPIFLPSMWMFALYWNDRLAAALGVVWIIGRFLYMTGYSKAAKARGPGFAIQALATALLLFGALAGAINAILKTGQI